MPNSEITLTQAASALRLPYGRTRDLALRGLLEARQDQSGRWLVTSSSVERERDRRTSANPDRAA